MTTCILCEHFEFTAGEPGYSDVTPATNARVDCSESKFESKTLDYLSEEEFRDLLCQAETCSVFQRYKDKKIS